MGEQRAFRVRTALKSIKRTGDEVVVTGTIERPTQGRFPPALVRYPIEVRFSDFTDITIEDDERIGVLIVGNIATDRSTSLLRV